MKFVKNDQQFKWIGEGVPVKKRGNKIRYKAFSLGTLKIAVGEFVLIRNDDALEPEDIMSCFVAQVNDLIDTGDEIDPCQAKVQWFSRVLELPTYAIKSLNNVGHAFEIVKDNRSSWHDMVDGETIFQKCEVLFLTSDADFESALSEYDDHPFPVFFCRYAFSGTALIEVEANLIDQHIRFVDNKSSITNGCVSQNEVQNGAISEESVTLEKRNNIYRAICIGSPSKCPKVLIKKIDDKILESKNGNIRIFVADSNVEKPEDVAKIFFNKLKLGKEELPGNLEKKPIIHKITAQNDISEELMDCNSNTECRTPNTPKIKQKNHNGRNSTPISNKSCRNLFNYKMRRSPRKNTPQKNSDVYSTPTKKARMTVLDDLRLKSSDEQMSIDAGYSDEDSTSTTSSEVFAKKLSLGENVYRNSGKEPVVHTLNFVNCSLENSNCKATSDLIKNDSEIELTRPETSKTRKSCISKNIEISSHGRSHKKKVLVDTNSSNKNSPCKSVAQEKSNAYSTPKKKAKFTDVVEDFCLTRSGRRVKAINYSDQQVETNGRYLISPTKVKLPRYVRNSCSEDSDSSNFSPEKEETSDDDSSLLGVSLLDEAPLHKTRNSARKSKKKAAIKKSANKPVVQTPTSKKSIINLSIPERKTPLRTPKNALEESRQRLHVSAVPNSLPCRDEEYSDIYSFVKGCLCAQTGGCMYISGVPGTGKTATVHEVMRNLEEEKESGEIPIFTFVEVNGMWMTDPYQCYVQIFKALTGKSIAPQQAADLLEKRFTERGPKKDAVVLLVDELDRLWTRKQTVMYNIFDWPTKKNSKLIVLAIANTMDLPERMMMNRISSRLGLTRKTFQPYTFKQLQEIIMSRIQELKVFDPDAVQLVARKVAAISGDARRALDICRFATETVTAGHSSKKGQKILVGMEHVDIALQQMFSSPVICAIRSASKIAKLFFQCMLSEFTRSGLEETILLKVHRQVVSMCRFEGLQPPTSTEISRICADLAASHLILVDNFRNDLYMKIRLNISSDDVTYALTLK